MDRAVVRNLVVGFVMASSIYLLGCGGSNRICGATSSQNAQGTTTPAASTAPSSSTSTDSSSGSSASGSSASGSSASGSAASGSAASGSTLFFIASGFSAFIVDVICAFWASIFVMSEENLSYGSVMGNTSQMPFINSLLAMGTVWSNFYANQHGSMHAYIETLSGTAFTCSGNDCGASGALTGPSLMDLMNARGYGWKGYFRRA